MKVMKRFLAMVLTLAMVATLFAGLTLTASAATIASTSKWTEVAWKDIKDGDTIIIGNTNNKALPSTTTTTNPTKTAITVSGTAGSLTITPGSGTLDSIAWDVKVQSGAGAASMIAKLYQHDSTSNLLYLTGTSSNTALRVGNNTSNNTFTMGSGGKLLKVTTAARYVGEYVSGSDWRTYNSETGTNYSGQSLKFYRLNTSTTPTHTVSSAVSPSGAGTVSLGAASVAEGSTTTATANPGANYTFTGWTISGTGASLSSTTANPTTITMGTANVTVTANFAAKQKYTVTYSVNGDTSVVPAKNDYEGTSYTLPTASDIAGYTFVGWLPTTYATNDTAPSGLITGTSYTMPAANTTLYAVYAIETAGGSVSGYQLSTKAPKNGDSIVIAALDNGKYYALGHTVSDSITGSELSITNGVATNAGDYVWEVESKESGACVALKKEGETGANRLKFNSGKFAYTGYASGTGTSNTGGIEFVASGSGFQMLAKYNTRSVTVSGHTFSVVNNQTSPSTIYIFTYQSGSSTTYSNYTTTVNTSATTYTLTYSANPAAGGTITCASTSGASIEEGTSVSLTAQPAAHYTFTGWTVTGTEDYVDDGNELLVTMTDDVTVTANFTADPTYTVTITSAAGGTMAASKTTGIYAGETITLTATPSAHYSFNGWQCTAGGASISGNTFTMPAANVTITGSFTEAAQYTVTYSVNGDTTAISSVTDYVGTQITLPADLADEGSYTFAGWVESAIGTETTTAPTVLTGSYTMPAANTTLYAVYTRTEGGSGTGSSDYVKVTKTSDLTDGQYLIVYEDGEVALDSSLATIDAVEDTIDVTISNNTIPSNTTTDNSAFTFTASNGSFLGTNGKYIGHTGSKNTLDTSTEAMSNTVSIDNDGNAVIDAGSNYVLRYNNTSGQYRFRFYTGTQQPIQLYKKGSSGTTYYTTTVLPPAVSYTLTYSASPAAGGSITCASASGDSIEEGTSVSLTAAANQHYTFTGWTVNDESAGNNATLNITMDEAKTVVANFTADPTYTVTLNQVTGGTLVANKTADIYAGEEITVTANPAVHYTFEEFNFTGLSGTEWSADDNVLTFTMPANNVTVTPSFTEAAQYTVTFYASSLQADTGSALSTQSVYSGESATAPTPDSKDGFSFVGWYTTAGTWSTDPGVLTSSDVNAAAVNANVTYYGVWAEGGSAASEYTTAPVQTLVANDDTVIIDWALPVTFNVLTNDNINVTVEVTADTLPSGVVNNGDGSFTFTPSGWQTADRTFTYTLSGTVNGEHKTDTATVTLKTADSVYYEDTYSGIFTFTGNWTNLTDGDPIAEQTSSLDTADIFEYNANYESYAQYSGGTAKTTTVSKGAPASVSFTFAGTGFDVISATTNNGGAVLMQIKDAGNHDVTDPVTDRNLNAIYDNFRGYVYSEEGYTRYTLAQVERCDDDGTPNPTGAYYYVRDNDEYKTPINDKWYTQPDDDTGVYYTIGEAETFFEGDEDEEGTYIIKEHQSHWMPYDKAGEQANAYNTNYYQIPIIKVTGLTYGTYTVTLTPTYSSAYDRAGDGNYDFIFDGVRIHNPVANRAAEYKYISINDAVKAGEGFGSGEVVTCDHVDQEWSDWTFYSRARNTNSETTNNRGSFVQYCSYCGGVANTAYFHVAVTADATNLGVGGYNNLPANTTLRYTLTADAGGNQAAVQAKLDSIRGTLTEHWSSSSGTIMTCVSNSNVVNARGAGTTYATLQLKDSSGTIYASAIHSPNITVYADANHTHTFGAWTHDTASDPSTHTHTCTDENCSFYETEECVFTEEVTLEPTQSTPGTKTYTCSACGYSYEETIPALGGHTATFHVPAGATAPAVQTGSSVTMPAAVAAPADFDAHSYTFVGWVESTVSDTTTEQTVYEAGESFDLSADTDFYALYSYGGNAGGYTLSSTAPQAGDSVIIAAEKDGTYYALPQSSFTGEALTVSGNTATNVDGLTWTAYDAHQTTYTGVGFNNGTNPLHLNNTALKVASGDANATLEFTASGDGFIVYSNQNDRWMKYNGSSFGVANAASGATPIVFFISSGATYYTTNLAATCKHPNTTTDTTAATCTEAGSETVTCDDCHEVISVTPIAALGHDYTSSVSGSVTTYTCSRCGDTYTEDSNFAVSYILQDGLSVNGGSRSGNTITLPTGISGMNAYDAHTYTFVGWATESGAASSTQPTLCTSPVTITEDTSFYPVYSFGTADGTGTWTLLENASTLSSGMKVVFASKEQGKTAGAISDSIMASIASTFSSDKKTITYLGTGTVQMTVGGSSGAWTFSNGSALLGATAVKKVAWGSGTTTWDVTISNGSATIQNGTQANGRFLYNVNSPRFTTYSSDTSSVMLLPQIYYQASGASTLTYTFELEKNTVVDTYAGTVTASPSRIELSTGTATVSSTLKKNGTAMAAGDYTVTYALSSGSAASLDGTTVTADANTGSVTITATFKVGDTTVATATCTVTVYDPNVPVTVNYIQDGTKLYNWGTRGTTANFLTEPANDYYTGDYSYDVLSQNEGGTSASNAMNSDLYAALQSMLESKHTDMNTYSGCNNLMIYTDAVESSNTTIYSFYSGVTMANTASAGGWNKEHTWPHSKDSDTSNKTDDQSSSDIMIIRPTKSSENSSRGNKAYGNSSGYYNPNSATGWDGNDMRGDVARMMLYNYVAYGKSGNDIWDNMWGTSGVFESLTVMYNWMVADPVDTTELGRNDSIQSITGARNPFVDYPELFFLLFGYEIPANYTTPSASGIVAAATYSNSRPAGYEPVTEAAPAKSIAPAAPAETEDEAPASKPATRSIKPGSFDGAVIIDGKGTANTFDDFEAYGPNNEVYLAPGQGIVFSLSSDIAITSQDLQIGAKAVNGTAAAIDVASISNGTESTGIKYLLQNKAIASATEMYYELDTTQMGWNGTESSVLVIYNSGEGVLSLTNLRYSTGNNNTLTMNINEVQTQKAAKMIQIVYGEPITDPDPIEPTDLDLNFASAELVLNSDIAINFNVEEEVMDSADGVYAVFTKALYNIAGEITGYAEETVTEPIFNEETGLYSFRFTGINPAEMGSAVTATLYGYRDGELVEGKTINYSVLTYINNMYGKVNDADFRALIADLAAYGEAAQNFISYNTANLVTASAAEGLMAYATPDAPELSSCTAISGEGAVAFTGAYLSLREKVTVCYMIDASEYAGDIADLELRIYDGKNLLGKISGADFAAADGKYIASFSGLNALQMRTVLTAVVFDGDSCVSNTLDYSVESYAASKAAGNDALAALVNAMMSFGISAETYFAK